MIGAGFSASFSPNFCNNMGCNWSALLIKNRCKAIGVAWDEQELKAIYELKIPPDYVRAGCLTLEQYQQKLKEVDEVKQQTGKKPLEFMLRNELINEAKGYGIVLSEESYTTKAELINLIRAKQLPISDAGKQESV